MVLASYEFIIAAFNKEITSTLATISTSPTATLNYDAVIYQEVLLSNVLGTFQLQTDSIDITDASNTDVKYYVDACNNYMGLSGTWNPMLDGVVKTKADSDGGGTWGADGTQDSAGNDLNLKASYDYTRHLAVCLFGTHFGVDLFTNEEEIVSTLESSAAGHIQAVFDAAYSAEELLNDTVDSCGNNITKSIMDQMLHLDKTRFQTIENTSLKQPLPFKAGDKLSFRIVVKADSTQASSTTGASDVRKTDPNEELSDNGGYDPEIYTLKRTDKVYKVCFKLVSSL